MAFHICQNHPFIDGNKRVALASSLVFLDINDYTFNCKDETLYNEIMNVAKGDLGSVTAYICLEATAQGLGSCIIGIYDRKKICELLNIPIEKQFGAIVALGYPLNDTIRAKKRKAFDDIVRFV
jgi:nitroreductase